MEEGKFLQQELDRAVYLTTDSAYRNLSVHN